MPDTYRLGMFIKKKTKIEKEGFNPKDNVPVKVMRSVYVRGAIDISDTAKSNNFITLLLSKYSVDVPTFNPYFKMFYEEQ